MRRIATQRVARCPGFTLIELLVVVGIIAFLAAVLFPVGSRSRPGSAHRASCQSNLKQIGLAFLQYTQDYDERFMPIAPSSARPYGWAEAIQPYCKSLQLLQCPSEATREVGTDATQSGFTDYWMNARLRRAELKDFTAPTQTLLCGDGNHGAEHTSARYSLNALPRTWLKDQSSPANRHVGTMNILFADGHVKSIRASGITTGAPRKSSGTFALNWRE